MKENDNLERSIRYCKITNGFALTFTVLTACIIPIIALAAMFTTIVCYLLGSISEMMSTIVLVFGILMAVSFTAVVAAAGIFIVANICVYRQGKKAVENKDVKAVKGNAIIKIIITAVLLANAIFTEVDVIMNTDGAIDLLDTYGVTAVILAVLIVFYGIYCYFAARQFWYANKAVKDTVREDGYEIRDFGVQYGEAGEKDRPDL